MKLRKKGVTELNRAMKVPSDFAQSPTSTPQSSSCALYCKACVDSVEILLLQPRPFKDTVAKAAVQVSVTATCVQLYQLKQEISL